MAELLDRFAFVLCKPRTAGNVGAVARALKNMGIGDLRLVAPQRRNARVERAMAVHGGDVLERATVFATLTEALADRTLVVGTTCRTGLYRAPARPARAAAAELIELSPTNRIAIVFGPEDFGLSNQELKLCQRLMRIPTAPDYHSLNLAQAVMIVAYELRIAAGSAGEAAEPLKLAPAIAVDAMLARMAQALVAIGFLPADNPERIMFALRAMLGRSGVTPRELDILSGVASQIRWFAAGGRETVTAKRRAGRKIR